MIVILKLLILVWLVVLNSSAVFSQISLRKGNHDCRSHSLKGKPLLDAIRAGHYVSVRRLLQQGANANAQDDCGVSAVTYAAAILHPGILKELIAAGATVNVIDDFDHKPPLLWALEDTEVEQEERVYEIATLLAEAGTDVNAITHDGKTPLNIAKPQVRGLLIEAGAKY